MNSFGKKKERKFMGNSWNDMNYLLDQLCELEDDVLMSEQEYAAMELAIQSVTEIMNRMKDGKKINWD